MITVKQKIFFARCINQSLRLLRRFGGRGMQVECRRLGVRWNLDLDEGIDLSIYLFGAYEPRTLSVYSRVIRPGDVVFDIGANIGAHTLHFARLIGEKGRVYAFEPTDFAVAKLQGNLRLNPKLAARVSVHQCFLVAEAAAALPAAVFSSWPIARKHRDLDPEHLGKPKSLAAAHAITADAFVRKANIEHIDFVKLDVDGHELTVLRGFADTLRRFRPAMIIELAPFVFEGEKAHEFDDLITFLVGLGYEFRNAQTGRPVQANADALRRLIPHGSGLNVLIRSRPA